MVTRARVRRAAWAAILASLALTIATSHAPGDRAPASRAAAACAADLHARGITPGPGGCAARP